MKRKLAIVICIVFLVSGLIRIGVGGMMVGQAAGWRTLEGEAVEALTDTQKFMSERTSNLVGFSPMSYFAFIAFMSVTISVGALAQMRRKRWGLALIWVYVISPAALFVNFMTVNPKVALVVLAALLTLVLTWANRPPAPGAETNPAL